MNTHTHPHTHTHTYIKPTIFQVCEEMRLGFCDQKSVRTKTIMWADLYSERLF